VSLRAGRESQAAHVKNVDDLNDSKSATYVHYGHPQEQWLPHRFPMAQVKGVATASTTPIEDIMAGRTDAPVQKSQ